MDFHGINMQGMFYIEHQTELPIYENNRDYRRFIIVSEGGISSIYYGGTDRWMKVSVQTDITYVMNGGTGVNFMPDNNILIGNKGNSVKFVAPGNEGDVLTTVDGYWKASPPFSKLTCEDKGDIQTHNGTTTASLKLNGLTNKVLVIDNDSSSQLGIKWTDLFNDSNFCKMGSGNFIGFGNETTITNPFNTEPRFVFITINPTNTELNTAKGAVGEYWIRKTNTQVFVGNTGSSTCRFLWMMIK